MSLCIDNSFDIIVIICGLSPAIVELYFTDNETQSQEAHPFVTSG